MTPVKSLLLGYSNLNTTCGYISAQCWVIVLVLGTVWTVLPSACVRHKLNGLLKNNAWRSMRSLFYQWLNMSTPQPIKGNLPASARRDLIRPSIL